MWYFFFLPVEASRYGQIKRYLDMHKKIKREEITPQVVLSYYLMMYNSVATMINVYKKRRFYLGNGNYSTVWKSM